MQALSISATYYSISSSVNMAIFLKTSVYTAQYKIELDRKKIESPP